MWVEVFAFDFVCECAEDFVVADDVVPVAVVGYVADEVVVYVEAVSEVYLVEFVFVVVFGEYVVAFWLCLVVCDFL
ncbi:hypothetical protein [Halococcus sediminicola]|uniref:hypothetical protein n=1 Tax=Halococcus sediminicola TaxID=1264579 RepID=UPI00067914CA|nr:hypothetical protein [Halococcus sediminicola]